MKHQLKIRGQKTLKILEQFAESYKFKLTFERYVMIENEIISLITKANKIAILPHVSADGDALGSSLALALALNTLNKKPIIYFEEDIPSIYGFLPGREL